MFQSPTRISLPAAGLLLITLFSMSGVHLSEARTDRVTPAFTGTILPVPPQQKTPWKPVAALPEVLVTTTKALFEHGLADPRGCEYREIEVAVGSVWGASSVVKTHGWVLPAKANDQQRFAVCWNGLVYPVVSVADKANLKDDILAVVKADEEMRAKHAKERPDSPFYRFRHAWAEGSSVSEKTLLPLKACLLLRLGEAELARQVWTAWTGGMRENTNDDAVHLKDPYLMLATDWVWAKFDRAVCAHMRGDDNLALLDARALSSIEHAVETEANKRGIQRPSSTRRNEEGELPYLTFLEPLPRLLADQERRAKEPKREPDALVQLTSRDNPPNKAERITALIQALDAVSARQSGQPGGVSLGEDRIVRALIRQGDDAVEPLLHCLENDMRLTRSVHFHRDFSMHRSLIGVHEAAYVALSGILKTSFSGVAATGDDLTARGLEGRRAVVNNIRAYWNQYKGVPLEERWYRILADDKAPLEQWLQAAGNIVQPVDVEVTPGSMWGTGWITMPQRKPGEVPEMRGEVLRGKKQPAVAELMVKRIATMSKSGAPGSEREFALHKACDLTLYLAKWDIEAALPVLRTQVQQSRDAMAQEKEKNESSWTIQILGRYIARFTLARVRGKDPEALPEYAQWLRTVSPKAATSYLKDVFEPLWRYPDDPALIETAQWIFNDAASPWNPLIQKREELSGNYRFTELLETPLLGVPAFRQQLLRELTNQNKVGTIKLHEGGRIDIKVDLGWNTGTGALLPDPLAPPPGEERAFRLCDLYAWYLSQLDGTPRCELYWPEAERDRAVAACAHLLCQYGDRFRFSEQQQTLWRYSDENKASLSFAPLDHPATPEEVKNGLAIFSAVNEGQTRLWKLPQFPLKAKWVTLKKYPRTSRFVDENGKATTKLIYDQDGLIWQAEEVLKNGKWERYYGFVGRYDVARVPASEVELAAN